MKPVEPVNTVEIYRELHNELITLLQTLTPEDWSRPTVAGNWTVKDVVAHLLDSDIRRLSFQRDGAPQVPPETPIQSYQDLVGFLNALNADWVRAARRISPQLLVQFHSLTGAQVCELFASLDLEAPAFWGVAWAGQDVSPMWFDIAREYTEKWHHQQQIRDAVGAPPLYARKWLHPVLDAFFRGLPHAFREVSAPDGTSVTVEVWGEAGDAWTIQRCHSSWELFAGKPESTACLIRMSADTAWRLLTKGLKPEVAQELVTIEGERELGTPILKMLAIMG
ncbi:MAG: maleylpyruvate isomerase N-terminal domain-containing protein [Blastocatellia bacterium]|nr:maleylpyruvate isomerase N-terminal domain-containing protein [Blastocatellia bacterium]